LFINSAEATVEPCRSPDWIRPACAASRSGSTLSDARGELSRRAGVERHVKIGNRRSRGTDDLQTAKLAGARVIAAAGSDERAAAALNLGATTTLYLSPQGAGHMTNCAAPFVR
jgi:hypothetical protein